MYEMAISVIWFGSVIVGMILTMLMSRIISESHGSGVKEDECERIPAHQVVHEQAELMILIGKEA